MGYGGVVLKQTKGRFSSGHGSLMWCKGASQRTQQQSDHPVQLTLPVSERNIRMQKLMRVICQYVAEILSCVKTLFSQVDLS